jgi:hypothetical protein
VPRSTGPEHLPRELVEAAASVVDASVTVALLEIGLLVRRAVSPSEGGWRRGTRRMHARWVCGTIEP